MSNGIQGTAVAIGSYAIYPNYQILTPGSLVKFNNGQFASIVSVVGDGTGDAGNSPGVLNNGLGAVTLDRAIPNNVSAVVVYAAWKTTFTPSEISNIASALDSKKSFGIGYDPVYSNWFIILNSDLSSGDNFSLLNTKNTTGGNLDQSWMLRLIYDAPSWRVSARSQRYIFESLNDVSFYYFNTDKIVNPSTGQALYDYIKILSVNAKPDDVTPSQQPPLGQDYYWRVKDQETYPDGYVNTNGIRLTFWDSISKGIPNNPEDYINIVNPDSSPNKLLFWQQVDSTDGYQYYQPITIAPNRLYATAFNIPSSSNPMWSPGEYAYAISSKTVYQWQSGKLVDLTDKFKIRVGRNNLIYQWQHYSPTDQRINPVPTNIIDIFVLTSSYDTALRNWISTNGNIFSQPAAPSIDELSATFGSLESFKMISDAIVWHPVKYKMLFGAQADPSVQVTFKVVKVSGTTVSDNEVKSSVINAINSYFSLVNWDFGQSFFFTELAAYIHVTLATIVGSVVIVPNNPQAKFGDLFEISCNPDEIFISAAQVSDVQIVTALTESNLGIING